MGNLPRVCLISFGTTYIYFPGRCLMEVFFGNEFTKVSENILFGNVFLGTANPRGHIFRRTYLWQRSSSS